MNSPHLVLFDIDGTLVRGAGPHHKDALIEAAFAVMGVRCTLDDVDTSGRLDRDLLSVMLANAGVGKRRVVSQLSRLMAAAQQHYSANCKADLSGKLCPGVRGALEVLRENGVPMGIVSGNLMEIGWRKLELAGIRRYFTFGAFAEQGRSRARLAKLATWQARRGKLAARNCQVILIGDHANDIAAAKANGYRSVAVATGVMQREELVTFKPDLVLTSLESADMKELTGG